MNNNSTRIAESRFWKPLWKAHPRSPSVVLCRVPELEYASTIELDGRRTLDHCCGNGIFARLCWPDAKFSAGCDMNEMSLKHAEREGKYERVDVCDAGKRLPYEDGFFDLVFDNSALEHIPDLNASLLEVARVTRRGGAFAFNVLNHRYFQWWPLDQKSMQGYREWQPFYHALTLAEWRERLAASDFEIEDVRGYFNEEASRELARLDCEFSGHFIRERPSELVAKYNSLFGGNRRQWRERLGQLTWRTEPDEGAGYCIVAKRR
jgi:SAM-dependent methyltransferase